MRYSVAAIPFRIRYLVGGLLQLVGVALVIHYAMQPDDYYGDGTTHWEHASKDSAANYAGGAMVIGSAIAVGFLTQALLSRLGFRRFAPLALVAYVISLLAAYFFLTAGH